jgi:hypothetical protein
MSDVAKFGVAILAAIITIVIEGIIVFCLRKRKKGMLEKAKRNGWVTEAKLISKKSRISPANQTKDSDHYINKTEFYYRLVWQYEVNGKKYKIKEDRANNDYVYTMSIWYDASNPKRILNDDSGINKKQRAFEYLMAPLPFLVFVGTIALLVKFVN